MDFRLLRLWPRLSSIYFIVHRKHSLGQETVNEVKNETLCIFGFVFLTVDILLLTLFGAEMCCGKTASCVTAQSAYYSGHI